MQRATSVAVAACRQLLRIEASAVPEIGQSVSAAVAGRPRCLHTTGQASAAGDKERQQGKDKLAKHMEVLERMAPQKVKRPDRSPEELAEAKRRVQEYSRKCMHAHRQLQTQQKQRVKCRRASQSLCSRRASQCLALLPSRTATVYSL